MSRAATHTLWKTLLFWEHYVFAWDRKAIHNGLTAERGYFIHQIKKWESPGRWPALERTRTRDLNFLLSLPHHRNLSLWVSSDLRSELKLLWIFIQLNEKEKQLFPPISSFLKPPWRFLLVQSGSFISPPPPFGKNVYKMFWYIRKNWSHKIINVPHTVRCKKNPTIIDHLQWLI